MKGAKWMLLLGPKTPIRLGGKISTNLWPEIEHNLRLEQKIFPANLPPIANLDFAANWFTLWTSRWRDGFKRFWKSSDHLAIFHWPGQKTKHCSILSNFKVKCRAKVTNGCFIYMKCYYSEVHICESVQWALNFTNWSIWCLSIKFLRCFERGKFQHLSCFEIKGFKYLPCFGIKCKRLKYFSLARSANNVDPEI